MNSEKPPGPVVWRALPGRKWHLCSNTHDVSACGMVTLPSVFKKPTQVLQKNFFDTPNDCCGRCRTALQRFVANVVMVIAESEASSRPV